MRDGGLGSLSWRVWPRRGRRIAPRCATRPSNSRAKFLARLMRVILGLRLPKSLEKQSIERIPPQKANRCGVGGSVEFLTRYDLIEAAGVACGAGRVPQASWTVVAWFFSASTWFARQFESLGPSKIKQLISKKRTGGRRRDWATW